MGPPLGRNMEAPALAACLHEAVLAPVLEVTQGSSSLEVSPSVISRLLRDTRQGSFGLKITPMGTG